MPGLNLMPAPTLRLPNMPCRMAPVVPVLYCAWTAEELCSRPTVAHARRKIRIRTARTS